MNAPDQTLGLLDRWHEGDRKALETLLERDLTWIEQRVRQRLGKVLRARVETDDLVQETVIEVLRYGPRFRLSSREQFRALLSRIVENVIRGEHDRQTAARRSLWRERPIASESVVVLDPRRRPRPSASQQAMSREAREGLLVGLELLDGDDRAIVLQREWEQVSFGEIAATLEIQENAARMRFQRAMGRLAQIVRRLEKGEIEELLQEAEKRDLS